MTDDDRYTRITLRIPKDLYALLQESSGATSKSINAEIIERVRQSFGTPGSVEDSLRQINDRLAALETQSKKKGR